jgi:hypothetical protein
MGVYFLKHDEIMALLRSAAPLQRLKPLVVGCGAVLFEGMGANAYSFGDGYIQKKMDPSIDFVKSWKTTKTDLDGIFAVRKVIHFFWNMYFLYNVFLIDTLFLRKCFSYRFVMT